MNYSEIGRRVRKYRKASGMSQEKLAEMINISVTHMSHIETGCTKMSLEVFGDITEALSVKAHYLLNDVEDLSETGLQSEINDLLSACTKQELLILFDVLRATKQTLDENL